MIEEIQRVAGIEVIERRITGARTTTMAVGGTFRYFIEPETIAQLAQIVRIAHQAAQKFRVLGAGSNLIVADAGVQDLVIRLGRGFRRWEPIRPGVFSVSGAMPLMILCRELSDAGFAGLEFAGGIPASMGGAVRMNAGAHGGSIGDLIEQVTVVTPLGEVRTFEQHELSWSYRRSIFTDGSIVVGAVLKLTAGDTAAIQEARNHFLLERKKRQPLTFPSAGSIFKNPPSISAGALLEQAGLKGHRIGQAEISTLHANWIINPAKKATASDIESLISLCKERALSHAGIEIEREVIGWS